MQKEVDGRGQALEKLRDEIEKGGKVMTAAEQRAKRDLFESKRREAARLADDFQKELKAKERKELQEHLDEISVLIERLGAQRGYWLVLEKKGIDAIKAGSGPAILYPRVGSHSLAGGAYISFHDLTADVIEMYDAETNERQ